jgi:hypothetical protein
MLQTKNLRTAAIGVSAIAVAAAGLATIAMGDSPSGRQGTPTRAAARPTVGEPAATPRFDALGSHLTAFGGTSFDSAFAGPAPANRMTDRPRSQSRMSARSTTPAGLPAPARKPLVSAHVGGPVTVQVDTDEVLTTVGSAVKTATNTVIWAKTTVDRTVQSLPVKASVTQDKNGTTVTVSAVGTTASAHVG